MTFYATVRVQRLTDNHYVEIKVRLAQTELVAAAMNVSAFISGLQVGGKYFGWCRELSIFQGEDASFHLNEPKRIADYIEQFLKETEE